MQAGKLDRRIEIYQASGLVDGIGQVADEPGALLAAVWAEAMNFRGGMPYAAHKVVEEAEIGFVIRYRADVEAGQFVKFEGRFYQIVHVGLLGRRDGLILESKRVTPCK